MDFLNSGPITYEEANEIVETFSTEYNCEKKEIGYSEEKNAIYALERKADLSKKGTICFVGGQHFAEPSGVSSALQTAYFLLTSESELSQEIRNHYNVTIIPMVNVDRFKERSELFYSEGDWVNATDRPMNEHYGVGWPTAEESAIMSYIDELFLKDTETNFVFDFHASGGHIKAFSAIDYLPPVNDREWFFSVEEILNSQNFSVISSFSPEPKTDQGTLAEYMRTKHNVSAFVSEPTQISPYNERVKMSTLFAIETLKHFVLAKPKKHIE